MECLGFSGAEGTFNGRKQARLIRRIGTVYQAHRMA